MVKMLPLFDFITLNIHLVKTTKSLYIEMQFKEGEEFFSKEMLIELEEVLGWLTGHIEIQTVILSSSSGYFSKGLDYKCLRDATVEEIDGLCHEN